MIRAIQNSFVAGEISPAIHARHDLKAYFNGAAMLRNFIVRRTGGVAKRSGTNLTRISAQVAAGVLQAGAATRVIPFFYDATTAYLLFVSGGTSYAAAYVYSCASDSFAVDGSGDPVPIALGAVVAEEWVGLTSADLPSLSWRQAGDTLFLVAPGHVPSRIVRAAGGTWSYLAEPDTDGVPSVAISMVSESNNVIGNSGSAFTTVKYGLWEERGGRKWLIKESQKNCKVAPWPDGGVITTTVVMDAWHPDSTYWICKKNGGTWGMIGEVKSGAAVFEDTNYLAKENIYTQTNIRDEDAGGYGLIDFYQQRTVLAGSSSSPFRLWFSRLSDLHNWWADRPLADDCPFAATLPAVRAAKILHLVSEKRLILLTEDGAFAVHSEGEGFSYRSCKIERASRSPCSAVRPFATDSSVIYVASDGRRLIEMTYDWASDGFRVADRSVLSEHLTEVSGIAALAWQESPDAVLWTLLANGTLLSFTYMPEHEVYAWAQHVVTPPMGCTAFKILDIVATGAADLASSGVATTSQVYALASWLPTGSSTTAYGVLKLRMSSVADTDPSDALDCREVVTVAAAGVETYKAAAGAVWKASGAASWTTVAAAATLTFAGGEAGASYIVGYPVQGRIETLRPEMPQRNIQGLRKNIVDTVIRVRRTGALQVSRPGDTSVSAMPAPTAGTLLTGDFKTAPRGACDNDGRLVIESLTPSPAEVLSVITSLRIEDLERQQREDEDG